ncbi:type IV toxin-antitoxin system AbiEi family antitoxin domain-containing protein [Aeromicrobium sp.]|uniref:type IV toxin-antitoxin system AbiEi family antitoxin domain-containing protein n=1 Tax=Aeromicrobium sp. TaxID=1871063 RepID=UPI0030BB1773
MSIIEDQHGVLTRIQALELMSRHHLYRLVESGIWRSPARGVFVNHNGPLTPTQRDWVALLAAPPGSVLGGLTALSHEDFDAFRVGRPTVVAKMGASPFAYDDVDLHWSTYLDTRDVHPLRLPPRTRPARSVVDAASWEKSERRARAIVLAAAQHGIVSTRHLREALTRRGACRHRALIVESYLDAAGGIQSLPERDFDQIRLECRLPTPDRQAVVRRRDGKYYLDARWRRFNLSCEVHGIPHMRVENWDEDLLRLNEVSIRGDRTLVFSSYAIRRLRSTVKDQLLRMTA